MSANLTQTIAPATVNLAVDNAGYPKSVAAAAKFNGQKCESISDHLIGLKSDGHPSMKDCAVWSDARIAVVSLDDKLWLKTPDGTLFGADKIQSSGVLKPNRNKGEVVLDQISAGELLDSGQALMIKISNETDARYNAANPGSRISVSIIPDKAAETYISELSATRAKITGAMMGMAAKGA